MKKGINFERYLFLLIPGFFFTGALLRAFFVDFSDFDYGVLSDHFINSVTAKNIAAGLGWGSSGYENYLLNPENLTVGPTIVLSIALFISLFGAHLTTITTSMLLLNTGLLLCVLLFFYRLAKNKQSFYLGTLLLFSFFIFFKSYYWYRMIGEIVALLLLFLTAIQISLFFRNKNKLNIFLAGFSSTLALGAKELTLLPLSVLCVILFIYLLKKDSFRNALFYTSSFIIISGTQPVLFFFYKALMLSHQSANWIVAYHAYADEIHNYYSGILVFKEYLLNPMESFNIFNRVIKATMWNGATLLHLSYAGIRGLYYWLFIYTLLLVCLFSKYGTNIIYQLSGLLALMALPLLFWFFSISEHAMPRHLYIGLCLAILSILFYLPEIQSLLARYIAIFFSVLLLVYTGDLASRNAISSLPLQQSSFAKAVLETNNYILQQPKHSIAWIGMIDNNEFEFLSPEPNNFINGYDAIARSVEFDQQTFLQKNPDAALKIKQGAYFSVLDYFRSPDNNVRTPVPVKLTQEITMNWLHLKADVARFHQPGAHMTHGQFCKELLFQNQYYVVERCVTSDIDEMIDHFGGLPVLPRLWRPDILFPAERSELP